MAEVPWLIRTRKSQRVIITAPDAPVGVGAAVDRLAAALDGFTEAKPAWFRPLERLGYWWYPICMIAMVAVFVAFAPNSVSLNIAYGLGFGVGAAVFSGAIITSIANLQTRMTRGRTAEETIKEVATLARPAPGVADRIEAILAWDPGREHEVHELAWRAAEVGQPGRWAHDAELDALRKLADPTANAARDAKIREVQAAFDTEKRER